MSHQTLSTVRVLESSLLSGELPQPVELLAEVGEPGPDLRVDLPHLRLVRRPRELADRHLRSGKESEMLYLNRIVNF